MKLSSSGCLMWARYAARAGSGARTRAATATPRRGGAPTAAGAAPFRLDGPGDCGRSVALALRALGAMERLDGGGVSALVLAEHVNSTQAEGATGLAGRAVCCGPVAPVTCASTPSAAAPAWQPGAPSLGQRPGGASALRRRTGTRTGSEQRQANEEADVRQCVRARVVAAQRRGDTLWRAPLSPLSGCGECTRCRHQ